MPLHINLAIGLQILNLIEKDCIQLDNDIKTAKGQVSADMEDLISRIDHFEKQAEECQSMIISNQSEISSLDKEIVDFLEQNRQYLEKQGRAFVNTSKEARLVLKQYKELTATNLKLNKKQKET